MIIDELSGCLLYHWMFAKDLFSSWFYLGTTVCSTFTFMYLQRQTGPVRECKETELELVITHTLHWIMESVVSASLNLGFCCWSWGSPVKLLPLLADVTEHDWFPVESSDKEVLAGIQHWWLRYQCPYHLLSNTQIDFQVFVSSWPCSLSYVRW